MLIPTDRVLTAKEQIEILEAALAIITDDGMAKPDHLTRDASNYLLRQIADRKTDLIGVAA